ncbi:MULTISPECIES: hypothetical protein [Pseudoalteromonas]|uniref:Uncharacterized protein n=1 Tax=Pseudoalteromonas amylolytica TaxID=1859457 RepID=A0A1S1MYN5_9GAMM|nr:MULTISPECIES: hypothetical protein [Pseudoalteromonas]OHU84498.1 hypothetical protein BFC16_00790 [Pseudoalteromonas sp. JW3]OHU92322.1 hypothetical protein BET10_06005 [Pseudoalteromonas amylolytica]
MRIIAALLLSLVSFASLAGSGKAIVPMWHSDGTTARFSDLYISNITDKDIEVKITVYKADGSVFNFGSSVYKLYAI